MNGCGLAVGDRVLVTRGHSAGERGVILNSPGRVFNGWTVKLDNGRIFGAGSWELRKIEGGAGAPPSTSAPPGASPS